MTTKVRQARPDGWTAPGPRPRGDDGSPGLACAAGESLAALCGDFRVFQRTGDHTWTTDDLVTADVADQHAAQVGARSHLDLGCGTGSVMLMLAWRREELRCTGVERQPERAALARRSTLWNGVEARCRIVEGDLRDPGLFASGTTFDLITGTPPYFPIGTGTEPDNASAAASRFEHHGGVEAYLEAADRWLGPRGRLVLCGPPSLDGRLRSLSLQVREVLAMVPRDGKAPLLHLTVLSRDAVPVRRRVLVVRDAQGHRTAEFRALRDRFGFPPGAGVESSALAREGP